MSVRACVRVWCLLSDVAVFTFIYKATNFNLSLPLWNSFAEQGTVVQIHQECISMEVNLFVITTVIKLNVISNAPSRSANKSVCLRNHTALLCLDYSATAVAKLSKCDLNINIDGSCIYNST